MKFDFVSISIVAVIIAIVSIVAFPLIQSVKPELVEVKVVGHRDPTREGSGFGERTTYEHWIYEDTKTKRRYISTIKYGNHDEVFVINKANLAER